MFLNDNYKMLNDWFKNRNILNIPDTNKFIYRIIPMVRLEQMLQTKQNTLVKIKLWEDPYENFFFKENFINRENHEPIGTDYVSSKYMVSAGAFLKIQTPCGVYILLINNALELEQLLLNYTILSISTTIVWLRLISDPSIIKIKRI